MLNSIRQFFENKLVNNEEEPTSSSIAKTDLACAALLIEVINSDHKLEEQETQAFFSVLQNNLNIPGEDIDELVELAENQAKEATSLYEFT
ncbi:MAG: TerB family tellurite resistance protein, partial [Pseudomonadota bacterium]|nr:TerB family tellurite resistance protein [Pseudomonadota bacterium]